jgi:cytochrome P450
METKMKFSLPFAICIAFAAIHTTSVAQDALDQSYRQFRDQAQRNAEREAAYGSREQARRWQQQADYFQSNIESRRALNTQLDQAGKQILDILNRSEERKARRQDDDD